MITLLSSPWQRRHRRGRIDQSERRSVRHLLVAVFATLTAVLGLSVGTAHAENTVANSSPSTGAVLDAAPDSIVIGFTEDLGETNTIALDCEAEPVTLPAPDVVDGNTLEVEITEALPAGTCTARWAVSNTDGEPNGRGVITFVVENADPEGNVEIAAESTDPTATTSPATTTTDPEAEPAEEPSDDPVVIDFSVASEGDAAIWLFQFASTLGIAVLFGSLVLITAAWPEGVEYLVTIRFLRVVWVVAMVTTVIFTGLGAAAVTPDGGGGPFSPGTWIDLLDAGWPGRAVLLRVILLAAAAWPAFRPERVIDPTTQLAALGIPGLCVAMLGITRTSGDWVALGVVMGILHALAMAVWVGGVVL
ncbi:copper resistance protein CopC, partial [Ilumatobacter sp.]|uniref:copper resistance CopC family protein n=1 Tax=Ilumatobacter sp. TaxID=1967498 RepID=UPI003C3F980A